MSRRCDQCGERFVDVGGPHGVRGYWLCDVCNLPHRKKEDLTTSNLFTAEKIADRIVDEHVPGDCMSEQLREKLQKEIQEQLEVAMARRTSLAQEIAEGLTSRGFHATKTYEHGDLIGDVARALDRMITQDQENKTEIDRLVNVINNGPDLSQLGIFAPIMELNKERHGPNQITNLGSNLIEEAAEFIQARCKVFREQGTEGFAEANVKMWEEFCDVLICVNAVYHAMTTEEHEKLTPVIQRALIKWLNEEKKLKEQRDRQ